MAISDNIKQIQQTLEINTRLLVVSKTRSIDEIKEAMDCGQIEFGENRVQELIDKASSLNEERVSWHFIGNLQTNKVKPLLTVRNLTHIHSVNSEKLLRKILSFDQEVDHEIKLFLQVNTSGEAEKGGFESLSEVIESIDYFYDEKIKNFKIAGLMTMGKIRTDEFESDARECFSKLKKIGEQVEDLYTFDTPLLYSMGMSQDYKIAMEFGTDYVRVGSAIFKDIS